jgi:hypothetical protein
MVSGRMKVIENLPDDALQDMIVGILARSLPM